jgi:hypothetical protein
MIKKRIIIIVLALLAVFVFGLIMISFSGGGNKVSHGRGGGLSGCDISNENLDKLTDMGLVCDSYCVYSNVDNQCGACCILNSSFNLTNWLFIVLMMLSSATAIYGGYLFTLAGQSPAKAEKGKTVLIYAAVGIVISFFSQAIPSLVKVMLGI